MNLKRMEAVFKLMQQYGIEHYKSPELEVRADLQASSAPTVAYSLIDTKIPNETQEIPKAAPVPPTGAAVPPREMNIPHHINEVVSMLKMSDEDLVAKLFPEGATKPEG